MSFCPLKTMKHASQLCTTAIVLTVCSLSFSACHSESQHLLELVADSKREFSGIQGASGWFYGYWERNKDADHSYSQTADFQLLTNFGSDPINQLSSRFNLGGIWFLQDGLYYTSLWAEGGHPNCTLELGAYAQVEQWPVRRWVSTVNGPVTISGHAGKVMPWGENWGGSCQALIVVDGIEVFSAPMDNLGIDYSVDVSLRVGSLVDFLTGPDPAVGITKFDATVRSAIR